MRRAIITARADSRRHHRPIALVEDVECTHRPFNEGGEQQVHPADFELSECRKGLIWKQVFEEICSVSPGK